MQKFVTTDAAKRPAAKAGLWVLIPILAATIVYARVLGHYFAGDEFMHFFNLANYGFAELVLTPHGGHILVTSNAVYAPLFSMFGLDATGYYALALLTHLCAVGLMYGAIRRWSGTFTAVVVSTLWGICPLTEGSVGWFGVYGHILVGAAVAWILRDAARVSTGEVHPSAFLFARWYFLILIAATSFGFGLSIAVVFPIAVYGFISGAKSQRLLGIFATLWIAIPVLYISVQLSHAFISDREAMHGISEVTYRPEFVDLLRVTALLIEFLSVGVASVPFGSWIVLGPTYGASSESVLLFSKIVLFGLVVLFLWKLRSRTRDDRLRAASCVTLALACYGTIALWAVMRSGGLEMEAFLSQAGITRASPAVTPRYHYVAPMLLAVSAAIAIGPVSFPRRIIWRIVVCSSLVAMVVTSYLAARVSARMDLRNSYDRTVAAIEHKIDRAPAGSDVYIRNNPFLFWGFDLGDRFPGWAAVFSISFPANEVRGRRVWFIEHDDAIIQQFAGDGSRISQLLVNPVDNVVTEPLIQTADPSGGTRGHDPSQ